MRVLNFFSSWVSWVFGCWKLESRKHREKDLLNLHLEILMLSPSHKRQMTQGWLLLSINRREMRMKSICAAVQQTHLNFLIKLNQHSLRAVSRKKNSFTTLNLSQVRQKYENSFLSWFGEQNNEQFPSDWESRLTNETFFYFWENTRRKIFKPIKEIKSERFHEKHNEMSVKMALNPPSNFLRVWFMRIFLCSSH